MATHPLQNCCAFLRVILWTSIYTAMCCLLAPAADRQGPVIEVPHIDPAPVIDGQLDDACWAQAIPFEGFYSSEWDGPAPEHTSGLICSDDKALYIAVVCRDRTPNDIVATETRRNGDLSDDDYVRLAIDPAHKHRDFYTFDLNAAGTQREYLPGGSATKIEWRGDWTAAASRSDDGWQAEVAIPFSILRYPPNQTCFGLSVSRMFGREQIHATWPDAGKTGDPTLAADLVGLSPPAERSRPLFMPYFTADTGDGYERGIDAGLDVQYKLPSGLTALATLNPDFKQIEDAVEPISFSYTERYLPELRPFFVTGQDGFLPREHLLYTRRIRDFDAGIKLFGTIGQETIGILDAITLGEENSFAAGWNHRFDDNNNAKLLLVSHQQQGQPSNLAYGLDACHVWRRPNGSDSIWTVLYESDTRGVGSGSSYAIGGSHDRGVGAVGYNWMLRRATPDFDPALGYYVDVNNIGGSLSVQKTDLYETGSLYGRQWLLDLDYYPYLEGDGMFLSRVQPGYTILTRNGRLSVLQVSRGRSYDYDNSSVAAIHAWNNSDQPHRGELSLVSGKAAGGDYTYQSLTQNFRPIARLSLRFAGERTDLSFPDGSGFTSYQAVVTGSYDLTSEKCIAARAIWRDSGFSAYAAYRQVVRNGMDAYLIVGDPDPARTGFAARAVLKLIWAFD
jgi:hypothetical protein